MSKFKIQINKSMKINLYVSQDWNTLTLYKKYYMYTKVYVQNIYHIDDTYELYLINT